MKNKETDQHPGLSRVHCQGRPAGQKSGSADVQGDPLVTRISRFIRAGLSGWLRFSGWLGFSDDSDLVEIDKKLEVDDLYIVAYDDEVFLYQKEGKIK